ncbi:hypothetical protein HMPREF1860_01999 [Prevotella amnii]|uniref:Uncharacterized protein n=1 Tax=Prevotella amnii TaxID=419005 RepID=A0A134B3Q1_9BACT|nr:hypothetical protein [Prevotella amnii]KXB74560.1 hypothetical protein HMPREF1860_01999 [Prevotella amnii]
MGVRLTTPQQEIDAYIEKRLKRMQHAVIRILEYTGERAVIAAIENHRYKNQTGNLEASTGYIIVDNGEIIKNSFGFAEGSLKGKNAAKELAAKYTSGLVLIVVAGMKYAVYVSDKGLDVLDSAEIEAQNILPQLLNQLSV